MRWIGVLQGVADACRVKDKMRGGTVAVGTAIGQAGRGIGQVGKKVFGEVGKLGRQLDRTMSSSTTKPKLPVDNPQQGD